MPSIENWISRKGLSVYLSVLTAVLFVSACQQDSSQDDVTRDAASQDGPGGDSSSQQLTADQQAIQQTIQQTMRLAEFIGLAKQTMGAEGITRIAYYGEGWEACLGQPWHIDDGWARWQITDYKRVSDFETSNSLQTAQRQAGMDPDKLGGCGAQPDANAQNQQSVVNAASSFEERLQLRFTPIGFLRLAEISEPENVQLSEMNEDVVLDIDVVQDAIHYHLTGRFGDDALLDHIETRIDNSVYGDMRVEAEFSNYQRFNGLQFPARIVQKQGGYSTLELSISNVIPNTSDSAVPPPREGRGFGGGAPSELPEYEVIGEGVYALHGAYQSVVMEFTDFSVVLDGLQNDARAAEIIRITKEIIPDKPIGYVLSTHNHFDHASGLRQFVAEGATVITHAINADFFQRALSGPRSLNPDYEDSGSDAVKVLGVTDFFAIDDGTQRVEFHKLNNSLHADDMLVAYIPAIKTIVEADLLQPWINPVFGGGEHPFLIYLADELDRLTLDYEQFVPIHRPGTPPLMSKTELLQTIGREP